jgi:tetratricopeptide (TPR) repeat protein|uniref:Tetratricopeptide repeat protein n=1 Tax=candidate division WOR-3 bacterium TaxID=2052148 RepID=A0A7V3PST1_UNCW3
MNEQGASVGIDQLQDAIRTVEFLLNQSRPQYPANLPAHHLLKLTAWREGTGGGSDDNPFLKVGDLPANDALQKTLELHRAYAEGLLIHEQLKQINFDSKVRETLIQRALGILPASESARFLEIHPCPDVMPRNIADSPSKLLSALELISRSFGEASALAYVMLIVAGLRARSEFENYGKKLDLLFEKIIASPAVSQVLELVQLNGRRAGFEPQFRLLVGIRERLWELKPGRLAPTGFLLTKVIDAYLSNRPGAGNVLGLALLDGILVGKFGFAVRYYFKDGVITLEIVVNNRSVYWDPTRLTPLSFEPISGGKRLSYADLLALSYASIANQHFTQTYWDRAIENFRRVLELMPDALETYADLALCYMRKNQPELAIKVIESGLKITPNSPALHHLLGNAYAQANQWRNAITAYKRAVQLAPKLPEVWYNMGLAYEKMGAPGQAEAAFQMAIELKPDYCAAHLALGNLLLEQQKPDQAIRFYREALKHDSQLVAAYYNLGRAYYEKKDLDNAIAYYQKAVKLNPKHAGAWHNLGIAYRDKGMKEKAVEALERAVALNPNLLR